MLDVFKGTREIEGHHVEIEIVDTAGDNLLGTNRALVYPNTDCFMLCVAVNNRVTLDLVNDFKVEIKTVNPRAPILLVGTKKDMRSDSEGCIPKAELEQQSREMGFQGIVETSSKEWQDTNIKKAFNQAIKLAYYHKYPDAL